VTTADHGGREQPGESGSLDRKVGLYARVFAVNASILIVAFLVLAFTPVSVNRSTTADQLLILLIGLIVMLAANAVLLRLSLAPLLRLTNLMRTVDILEPGSRLDAGGSAEVSAVISAFNSTLQRLEHERRSSMRRVLTAQEAERRRVAQELHDQIGQNLTAVILELKRARAEPEVDASEALADAQELARESLDELHRISQRLRPAMLDDLGLGSALAELCDGVSRRTGVAIEHDVASNLPRLGHNHELVIYRVAQEALTNALRHAECSQVSVRLQRIDDAVTLRVTDDGVGMNGARPSGGINGMRERALTIGARLSVGAADGRGVEVKLRVPVPSDAS
jgi:two-component system sensor histidine kinase UhpB